MEDPWRTHGEPMEDPCNIVCKVEDVQQSFVGTVIGICLRSVDFNDV